MTFKRDLLSSVLALVFGVLVMKFVSSSTILSLFTKAIVFAVFALGIGVLLKQNGMVSFGHAFYFGSAGYLLGIMLQLHLASAETLIFLTLFIITLVGLVFGLIIVRVPGVAFGMLTLAIGQMFYLTASRSRGLTGGADGMNIEWPSTLFGISVSQLLKPGVLFMICWTTLIVVIFLLACLLRSRFGAITEAVRDNEERARFIGISTLLPRAAVYALSALITGVAGVLAALNTGFVSPENLHWSLSGMTLMMVVVGGFKVLWGPALGAVVYFIFKDILGDYATHWMTIFGLVLITVIVFSPTGIAGALVNQWSKKFPPNKQSSI